VTNLLKAIAVLQPFDRLIVKYQSDKVPLSEVLHDFLCLEDTFEELTTAKAITKTERDFILDQVRARQQFLIADPHAIAYVLDPRYCGEKLSQTARRQAEACVCGVDPTQSEEMYKEFSGFLIHCKQEKKLNSFRFSQLEKGNKSPKAFWTLDGEEWPRLQQLAVRVFSLLASSAASERSFSATGFIHNKLRNRLTQTMVEKLVYVRSNHMLAQTQDESSSEEEQADDSDAEI
jgi:hypothetical protein